MNNTVKTFAGFKVENLQKLEEPVKYGHVSEPHIYKGDLYDLVGESIGIPQPQEVTWDALGQCNNLERYDCFLDLNTINI